MVTHPCINWTHDCLTSVIKHKMFTPCYVSPHIRKIDNVLKLAKDITISPFGTIEVKGNIKTPNHYKCVNVVVDTLPEKQCCKDLTVAQQIQTLKPGSNKIPVVLRNLSCRTLKVKKK